MSDNMPDGGDGRSNPGMIDPLPNRRAMSDLAPEERVMMDKFIATLGKLTAQVSLTGNIGRNEDHRWLLDAYRRALEELAESRLECDEREQDTAVLKARCSELRAERDELKKKLDRAMNLLRHHNMAIDQICCRLNGIKATEKFLD